MQIAPGVRIGAHEILALLGARLAGDLVDRDLSWLNWSWNARLVGGDRKGLTFTDASVGANYRIVWRGFDGSPPVQLGSGQNRGPSPDNTWVLGQVLTPHRLVLYPLGIGSPVQLKRGALAWPRDALWFPDGKSVLVIGNEPGRPLRAYRQAVPDGLPAPLLPEGVMPSAVTPDGEAVLAQGPGGAWGWYPVAGGPPALVPALTADDRSVVVGWASDGESPLLQNDNEIPARIERLDRVTGQRTLLKSVVVGDPQGLLSIQVDSLSGGGEEYTFAYRRRLSTLYVRSESRPAHFRSK